MAFHDIASGNNCTATNSPSAFYACAGYDLCTGLGSMTGSNMVRCLAKILPLPPTRLRETAVAP
jgi:hypothetical protein